MQSTSGRALDEEFIAGSAALRRHAAGEPLPHDAEHVVDALLGALERGAVRAAERDAEGNWQAVTWVKRGILLGFRVGRIADMSLGGHHGEPRLSFFDKHTYPPQPMTTENGVRIVPGGSSVRRGAYLAPGVVCMPPMYVNVGAYVGAGTMVDSHALVGSCAQIGERVHLSAAAQIGGVLEPVNAAPVVIEDDVLVGGNCGVYEGTIVRAKAVLAAGVVLTRGTPVYDLVHERVYRASADAARDSGGRRGRAGRAARVGWMGRGAGPLAADAGDREVPRREDRPRDRAGRMAPLTARHFHVAGELRVPGDKSISHRALIFGALADGTSRVRHPPVGRRPLHRRRAARARREHSAAVASDSSSRGAGVRRGSRTRPAISIAATAARRRACLPASSRARASRAVSSATRVSAAGRCVACSVRSRRWARRVELQPATDCR